MWDAGVEAAWRPTLRRGSPPRPAWRMIIGDGCSDDDVEVRSWLLGREVRCGRRTNPVHQVCGCRQRSVDVLALDRGYHQRLYTCGKSVEACHIEAHGKAAVTDAGTAGAAR